MNSKSAIRSPSGTARSKAIGAGRKAGWREAPSDAGKGTPKPRVSPKTELLSLAVVTSWTRSGGRLGATMVSSPEFSFSLLNGVGAVTCGDCAGTDDPAPGKLAMSFALATCAG